MQVKKEDLYQNILKAAKEEFIAKGYENSSLRTIARKANTTIGNIYHYFENKEDLLSVLMDPIIENLDELMKIHLAEEKTFHGVEEINHVLNEIDHGPFDATELKYLMDDRLLILFDVKTTKYVALRENFMTAMKHHMAFHLNIKREESHYLTIIADMFVGCIRHVLLERKDPVEAKKEFIKVFRMLCAGVISQTD